MGNSPPQEVIQPLFEVLQQHLEIVKENKRHLEGENPRVVTIVADQGIPFETVVRVKHTVFQANYSEVVMAGKTNGRIEGALSMPIDAPRNKTGCAMECGVLAGDSGTYASCNHLPPIAAAEGCAGDIQELMNRPMQLMRK